MTSLERKIRKFLKYECRRQRAYLWGKYNVFTPYLVKKIWGDGIQVIHIGTIDDRPFWWVVRIDSKTDIDNNFWELAEDILSQIEEECGRPDSEDDYKPVKYPGINCTMGYHWGLIKNFANPLPSSNI